MRGDVLIDDRSYNLENFQGRHLLFTAPHNIENDNFERVSTWKEIASLLLYYVEANRYCLFY
ncbi:MAG: hypothetical protein AAGC45_12890 [Bacteroidota bacterium]